MTYFNRNAILIGLVAFCSLVPGTFSSIYTLSDERVQNLDVTPVLGRGYSIMTNSFASTCLDVSDTTVPSYNYKYEFYDFIDKGKYATIETVNTTTNVTTTIQVDTSTKLIKHKTETYYSSKWIVATYLSKKLKRTVHRRVWSRRTRKVPYTVTQRTSNTTRGSALTTETSIPVSFIEDKNLHMVVSVMRVERYYSSIRDESSNLINDALTILDAEDYIGFFKACGPNYVRGIRRAQEVTGIFMFRSESVDKAKDYTKVLEGGLDTKFSSEDHKTSDKSLTISIRGYGLGLGVEGLGSLAPTNLEEYREAMKFAFRAMTQNRESFAIGQVHSIEVVPWVDNVRFQAYVRLQEVVIDVPLPRSLIPSAVSVDGEVIEFVNNATTRLSFRCKDPAFQIDKYGNCCEENDLYNYTSREYANDEPMTKICRPARSLDKSFIKNNMMANGEFVARLDSAVRYKLNELSIMQQCISAARAYPDRMDYHIIKSTNAIPESDIVEDDFGVTVLEMRLILDPFNDFGLVTQMTSELDEFVSMYYSPCLAALFGTNVGSNPNTDPTYFMAYPWHSHDECLHMSCLGRGMRWDRKEGGCIPGLMSGGSAAPYSVDADENAKCHKDGDSGSDTEVCKYDSTKLATYHTRSTNCWEKVIPSGQVSYYLDNYCMPQVSENEIDPMAQMALLINQAEGCEETWPADAKSKKFDLMLVRTRNFLKLSGTCVDGGKVTMSQKSGSASTAMTFEYNFATKTISPDGCDKVLTLSSCDDAGRITIQPVNTNLIQRWEVRDGGIIESVDCAAGYYIATKTTGQYESGQFRSELGVTTEKYNWEAIFDMSWVEVEA